MGAAHVTGVDLSPGSIELARRRASDAGYETRARYEVGNAADVVTDPQDWVILDRVICCFPEMDRLVGHAAPLARSAFVLSVPESRGWRGLVNRVAWGLEAAWDTIRGGCRGYVHDVRRLERRLGDAGLRRTDSLHLGLWYLGRYERT
jgi:magnesium-protoporphyrin O-methyltransferase